MSPVESALRRERLVVAAGLLLLTLAAWFHIWRGAGMGMTALQMTRLALFPHLQPEPMPGMAIPVLASATVVMMWWIMMIAMMTPSVAPLALLYGRVAEHHRQRDGASAGIVAVSWLVFGYLACWFAFALLAAALQAGLRRAELVSGMMLWSRSALLSAALLVGAGVYQLSPLKQRCLTQCRGPAGFLTRHWRPGRWGALRLGLLHGAWCVGCCGLLMGLLFVGGVMNIVWIALLSLLVLAEKLHPRGALIGRLAGLLLIAWGLATLAV